MYANVAGRAAFDVVAAGDASFGQNVLADVEKMPGVKAAVPTVQTRSCPHFQKKRVVLGVMGIDPECDKAVREYELNEGSFFEKGRQALLEVGFARGLGVKVGDQVKLTTTLLGVKTFTVTGLLTPQRGCRFQARRHHFHAATNRPIALCPQAVKSPR